MAAKKTGNKSAGKRSKSVSQAKSDMNLFGLLKKDHDHVKDLFEQIQEDGDMETGSRENFFSQIEEELEIHMEGEEKFFYPALKESEEAQEKVLEAYEEHHVAKTVLEETRDLSQEDERWKAKIKVLNELVKHHIEEEEGEVFKIAKKVLDKDQIQEITGQIQQEKHQRPEA